MDSACRCKEAKDLKEKGNACFKQAQYEDATKFYQQAVDLDPVDAVYKSNLSAAQLETGDYEEAAATVEAALEAIALRESTLAKLKAKLELRKARITTLTSQKSLVRYNKARKDMRKVNERIAKLPRYRSCRSNETEFYTIGHDSAQSIFRTQCDGHEHFDVIPELGQPFEFSALFVGSGDCRHILCSLLDLGADMRSMTSSSKDAKGKGKMVAFQDFNIHLTLNDIHAGATARSLVMLAAVRELASMPTKERKTSDRGKSLLLMLYYVMWGTAMPSKADQILEIAIQRLIDTLTPLSQSNSPFSDSTIVVDAETVKAVLEKLIWWRDEAKGACSSVQALPPAYIFFSRVLKYAESIATTLSAIQKQTPASQRHLKLNRLQANYEKEKAEIIANLSPTLGKGNKVLEEMPAEAFVRLYSVAPNLAREVLAFKFMRVLIPPKHASEPAMLERIFESIRAGRFAALAEGAEAEILEHISQSWVANRTLLDRGNSSTLEETAKLHDPFVNAAKFFENECMSTLYNTVYEKGTLCYDYFEAMFLGAADGMARIQKAGKLRLELISGEGYNLMEEIRTNISKRDKTFPKLFDRIHLSNTPDYCGGCLTQNINAMPLLKQNDEAYLASCCLLNSGHFEGGLEDDFEKIRQSYTLTYTGLNYSEFTTLNAQMHSKQEYLGYYTMWEHSHRRTVPSDIVTTKVLQACFVRCCLPALHAQVQNPTEMREPLTLQTFFRLAEYLLEQKANKDVIRQVITNILENTLVLMNAPHSVKPVSLQSEKKPVKTPLCTLPWVADFEVWLSLWEPRLFPMEKGPIDDITRYTVRLRGDDPCSGMLSPHLATLCLAIGKPRELEDVKIVRAAVQGKQDCPTSVNFVALQNYIGKTGIATFLLSKARVQEMTKKGYEVAIVDLAFWRVSSRKVPLMYLTEVGDADEWETSKPLVKTSSRRLTEAEKVNWKRDLVLGTNPLQSSDATLLAQACGTAGCVCHEVPPGQMEQGIKEALADGSIPSCAQN